MAALSHHSSAGAQADANTGRHSPPTCTELLSTTGKGPACLGCRVQAPQLPTSATLPAASEGEEGGGRSCSGAADLGKSGCQVVLGLPLCEETHRGCHCCSAVGLVCPGRPHSANTQRAQRNGLLPGVCRMHAWQRDLGRWIFFNPPWMKKGEPRPTPQCLHALTRALPSSEVDWLNSESRIV